MKGKAVGAQTIQGYKISPERYYVIDDDAATLVQKVFQNYDNGKRVCHIVKDLNEKVFKKGSGNKFSCDNVHRMLRNIKYTGLYTFGEIVIKDGMPQIISKQQFERVQNRMRKNNQTPAAAKAKTRYLLSGKAFCGLCGEKLIGDSGQSGSKKTEHFYYKCSKRIGECEKETVRKDYLETTVARLTAAHLFAPEKIAAISKKCVALAEMEMAANSELPMYKKQLVDVQKSKENIIVAIEAGIFTPYTKERLLELEAAEARLELDVVSCTATCPVLAEEHIIFMLTQFTQKENLSEREYVERLIDSFVHSVYLYDDKIIITFNLTNHDIELEKAVFSLVDDLLSDGSLGSDIEGKGYLNAFLSIREWRLDFPV